MTGLEPPNPEPVPLITIKDIKPTPEEFEKTVDEMYALHQRAFGEHSIISKDDMSKSLTNDVMVGAYVKDKLVGHMGITVLTKTWPGSWYLYGAAIEPDMQGKGIGGRLLKEIIRRADGKQRLVSAARPNNYDSIALLVNKNDFVMTGFRRNFFPRRPGTHRVIMESSPETRGLKLGAETIRIPADDIDIVEEKLNSGYVGVAIERVKSDGQEPEQQVFLVLKTNQPTEL